MHHTSSMFNLMSLDVIVSCMSLLHGTSINNYHRNSFTTKLCSYEVYTRNQKTIPGTSGPAIRPCMQQKIIATTGSMAFLSEELIAFSLKLKFLSIKSIIHLFDQISFANWSCLIADGNWTTFHIGLIMSSKYIDLDWMDFEWVLFWNNFKFFQCPLFDLQPYRISVVVRTDSLSTVSTRNNST